MKRFIFQFFLLCSSSLILSAQNSADALRFSQFGIGGTARTIAIGGSIGALGADFSVVSTNPAGIGTYRGSEFTMTPSLFLNNVEANLVNGGTNPSSQNKTNFNFNNIGVVFNKNINRENTKWKTSNFSIGINRLTNFNETISYSGQTQGSYIDFFRENSNGLFPEDFNNFDNGLAWDVGAIYDDGEDGIYESDVSSAPGASIQKSQTIERTGSINEVVFGLGGYRGEKMLFGATLGFPIVSYTDRSVYLEDDNAEDNIPFFRSMSYTQDLSVSGFGLNLKLGLIYRITSALRVGGAIHTPTRLRLTDEYQTSLLYDYVDADNDGAFEATSPEDEKTIEYDLVTPWRFIGSGALLIKKKGFISGEIEFVNHGGAKFKEPRTLDGSAVNTGIFNDTNNDVSDDLKSVIHFRAGGEYVIKKMRLRAGVNISTTPYAGESGTTNSYSAGFGYREKKFFIDATYKFSPQDDFFNPYSTINAIPQVVETSTAQSSLLLTLGFRF